MHFDPIAIIGQSCVLPGAMSPTALWALISKGRHAITSPPSGHWGLDPHKVLSTSSRYDERTWTDKGGYVHGFEEIFNATGFALPVAELEGLDPLFLWLLHTAREALHSAGYQTPHPKAHKVGVVVGNLSYPTFGMSQFAEAFWQGKPKSQDPRNVLMSGYSAHLVAQSLGLTQAAYALDAACASSLYAVKMACNALHDRRADTMLAGGINRADDLFLHIGFCALQALSRTGQSRPFHREADGLLPAEGAGFVVLKRLDDARNDGDQILGVIRGVGLSNDGRGQSLLTPSQSGQIRAMKAAYEMSGLSPQDISLVECHATGTPLGDAVELQSMGEIFKGHQELAIGSLKSNLGHLITASGIAGMMKVLGAFHAKERPPTLHATPSITSLEASPFRLIHSIEPWDCDGPRRAAINNFGFGGNNAHLLLEEWQPKTYATGAAQQPSGSAQKEPIAIIGIGIVAGAAEGSDAFLQAWRQGLSSDAPTHDTKAADIALDVSKLRFPPNDLKQTLPQQLLLLKAAAQIEGLIQSLPGARTGVLIGMRCDAEITRYGARWRHPEHQPGQLSAKADRLIGLRPPLEAAGVLGTMPNIVANRLNNQYDLHGPSLTLSSEELSGTVALQLAIRALQHNELDAALVGAADLCCEPMIQHTLRQLVPNSSAQTGDAAIVLVLKRRRDALNDKDPIFALLPTQETTSPPDLTLAIRPDTAPDPLTRIFGNTHAAAGLLQVTAAALACHTGFHPEAPNTRTESAAVQLMSFSGQAMTIQLQASDAPGTTALKQHTSDSPTAAHKRHHMTFASHWPKVDYPMTKPNPANPQYMPPAPWLPGTMASHTQPGAQLPPPGYEHSTQGQQEPHRQREAQVQPPQDSATTSDLHGQGAPTEHPQSTHWISQFREQFTAVHEEFLTHQSSAYQEMLALQARLQDNFVMAFQHGHHIEGFIQPNHLTEPWTGEESQMYTDAPSQLVQWSAFGPQGADSGDEWQAVSTKPALASARYVGASPLGPRFDREELERLASGKISEVLGPLFAQQDHFHRQVRMPEPPLLLADRVSGIDAEAGNMGLGTMWTETDVTWDSWYLHQGYMPTGIMIEAGQADLLLISWLGADFKNRGERMYRLLGCELTFHGSLPRPGDTLCYDIHVDNHVKHGDIRLFFFHYDCSIDGASRLSVRQGQAGFFSEAEMKDSGGVLWSAETDKPCANPRLAPPRFEGIAGSFPKEKVEAFSEGRVVDCFGPTHARTLSHTQTPKIQEGRMLLFDEIRQLDLQGSPWGRGYLQAYEEITPDEWYFQGHFKNDPCMPGTLMFEGCLQTMAFYMTAMGCTVDRDGWRFEPVPELAYQLRCRGQVGTNSKDLVYEVFVEEFIDGPIPTLYADLLCTVDGLKAFHCRRMGLQLVPDWPLSTRRDRVAMLAGYSEPKPVAHVDDFGFGYDSLLACAWGRPSRAFGEIYKRFDSHRQVARLPGPPYHFITRMVHLDGPIGVMQKGSNLVAEYDVPPDAWYFRENGSLSMPYSVLMEVGLQPCGWLASYIGCALSTDRDLAFRNLDGTGTMHQEVFADVGTLRITSTLKTISQAASLIIVGFAVTVHAQDDLIYEMDTVFGFFPGEALANQVGQEGTKSELSLLNVEKNISIDLTQRPQEYCAGSLRLAERGLLMIDEITGIWPAGGAAGLGQIRAEKYVQPDEWFFRAHFFQDPVQPGSLGIDAMCQTLQSWMLHQGMGSDLTNPRFEAIATHEALTWKYRGQVIPENKRLVVLLEITAHEADEANVLTRANGSLWIDGMCIYRATGLAMRIVTTPLPQPWPMSFTLDPAKERWLGDHCPTYTRPALPLMSLIDAMAQAVQSQYPAAQIVQIEDVAVQQWAIVDRVMAFQTEITKDTADSNADGIWQRTNISMRPANQPDASWQPLCQARCKVGHFGADTPDIPALIDAVPMENPYQDGTLFHGPSFQLWHHGKIGSNGAYGTLDASGGDGPRGLLFPILLDAALHLIPHDSLHKWFPQASTDVIGYPYRINDMHIYGTPPFTGLVQVEVRTRPDAGQHPTMDIYLLVEGVLWARLTLTEVLLPKGRLGRAKGHERRSFLRDRDFVRGMHLSERTDGTTRLNTTALRLSDWFPGTIASVYQVDGDIQECTRQVAIKEHLAHQHELHPSAFTLAPGGEVAICEARPLLHFPVQVQRPEAGTFVVQDGPSPTLDLQPLRHFWHQQLGIQHWPGEDLLVGMMQQFVKEIVLEDPAAIRAQYGRSALFVANHQVQVESILLTALASYITGVNTITVANAKHKQRWLGQLIEHIFSYPGCQNPHNIVYFEQQDRASMLSLMEFFRHEIFGNGQSVMVHVGGTRSRSCREPMAHMSSLFLDLAVECDIPLIPVRMTGGLPVEPIAHKLEFPHGHGRQSYIFGAPIQPATLKAMPYARRRLHVLEAINETGPAAGLEHPNPPNHALMQTTQQWQAQTGASEVFATLYAVLQSQPHPSLETQHLLACLESGQLDFSHDPAGQWLRNLALGMLSR